MSSLLLSPARVLNPIERVSEVFFGLIMVLTFTGSLSVAEAGRDDVRAMLIGALGCNLAWGIIDAILYLMGRLAEKGRNIAAMRAVRGATDPSVAQRVIAEELPPIVAGVLQPAQLETVRLRLIALPEPSGRATLEKDDWLGAAGSFLLVFLTTFPVAIPFMLMRSAAPAMRVSNLVAIVLLFLTGYAFGRISGHYPVLVGLAMVVVGTVLVGLTIALGG
jgi:VIT1/CCC1 family predicted Fe2+/Mn2+ transporter